MKKLTLNPYILKSLQLFQSENTDYSPKINLRGLFEYPVEIVATFA